MVCVWVFWCVLSYGCVCIYVRAVSVCVRACVGCVSGFFVVDCVGGCVQVSGWWSGVSACAHARMCVCVCVCVCADDEQVTLCG